MILCAWGNVHRGMCTGECEALKRRRVRLLAITLAMVAQPLAPLASGAPCQPTLWKLSSADSVVYLLGSIHLGLPEMYPLPQAIEAAFAASSVLLVETKFTSFGPQERSHHG